MYDVMGWDCACGARALTVPACPWCGRAATWTDPYGPPPAWPPPYAPPARRTSRGALLAAVAALLVVAAFIVAPVLGAADKELPPLARAGGALLDAMDETAPVGQRHSARFDATIASLERFVERAHGAAFTGPVDVRTLSDGDFTRRVLRHAGSDPFSKTLTGLGLAGGADPEAARTAVLGSGIVGLYDHKAHRLYVRGETMTPIAQLILVHELAHAWQDQYYGLSKIWAFATDRDRERAVRALIEGDAVRIENAWAAAQPASVRRELDRWTHQVGRRAASDAERAQATLLSFSYVAGARFVENLAARGGNAAVTEAFRMPPVSTEQVLDPEAYRAHDEPLRVPGPPLPHTARFLDEGVLGQAGLALLAAGGHADAAALGAVRGWEGDGYLTYRRYDGVTCTEVVVAMQTTEARGRLMAALARRVDSVTPAGSLRLRVRSCAD